MSCGETLHCDDDGRRIALRDSSAPVNGIDTVEVVTKAPLDPLAQRVLAVFFFHGVPAGLDNAHLGRFEIGSGGSRVAGASIHVVDAHAVGGHLELTLDRYGDFSDYVLTIQHPGLDPIHRCRRFNFKVDCPNPFDCTVPVPNHARTPGPPIDYLSKDYRSFRRALLDFLPSRVPGFDETNEADLAVTLAELFAYAGDQLSYYQDAVANEAYLTTARRRVSVKRHARLVDYRMHEGTAARAVLHFAVQAGAAAKIPAGQQVSVEASDPGRPVFETEATLVAVPEQNAIEPHTWENVRCCLPAGTTVADLRGKLTSLVDPSWTGPSAGPRPPAAPGLLLFEEVLGPLPDQQSVVLRPEEADPTRRQIVRLVDVEFVTDPLAPAGAQDVTRVRWRDEDALRVEFCLERDEQGNPATVARGNLVRASHGATRVETLPKPDGVTQKAAGGRLGEGPLTWLAPAADVADWLIPPDAVDPRQARSTVQLDVDGERWQERESLLDSRPDSTDFVVETDDDGHGVVRFGDGQLGRDPGKAIVTATYRIGNGTAGNVGPDVLVVGAPAGTSVRNPLPAVGGIDPEPMVDVRRDAPREFREVQYRAVTTADYAQAAAGVPGAGNAAATFRWTGSWLTVFDAVDAAGRTGLPPALEVAVRQRLESRRQAGYDLDVTPPSYVALDVALHLCVEPDYFAADVVRAVLDRLTSGLRLDGEPGFFHPDNFTFGQSLYLSRLYAAVQAVHGVRAVKATTFTRLHQPDYGELAAGVLTVGPFEVVRLDNDPSEPDNGILTIETEGGK